MIQRASAVLGAAALFIVLSNAGCSGCTKPPPGDDGGTSDGSTDAGGNDGGHDGGIILTDAGFCALPGSMQFTAAGVVTVPGGSGPSLSFLKLPTGFCAHYFGNVSNARQLRFAPGGELFVASPTTGTTSGGQGGQAAVVLLPDDNLDGYSDGTITFLSSLPSTQGMVFAPGFFYYQDGVDVMKLPYQAGQRTPSGTATQIAAITYYESGLHWPKSMDIADDGTLYVGNGGDQGETCVGPPHPFHGGILTVAVDGGSPAGTGVAQGFRNPIALRCQRGHDNCFALELAKDGTNGQGGREKFVQIRPGDDWGFPCCATANTPYQGITPTPDCSTVATDSDSFQIGETPFGLDFEPGTWPAPWTSNAFVVLHGAAGTWTGARVVAIPTDPTSGMPMAASDLSGTDQGMADFATGWDDNTHGHGRPAAITFSSDGRLFLSNDQNGDIFWIAPLPP